jgi:hypothetical protein
MRSLVHRRRLRLVILPPSRDYPQPDSAVSAYAIARTLGIRLGTFAAAIERVTVRVPDVSGPKGGVDRTCAWICQIDGVTLRRSRPRRRDDVDD